MNKGGRMPLLLGSGVLALAGTPWRWDLRPLKFTTPLDLVSKIRK